VEGHPAHLATALNANALPFFLLANLLTGAVSRTSCHGTPESLGCYEALREYLPPQNPMVLTDVATQVNLAMDTTAVPAHVAYSVLLAYAAILCAAATAAQRAGIRIKV
jgi:hypothetical protein